MSLADKFKARAGSTASGENIGQAAAVAARMQEDQLDRDSVILLVSQIEEDLTQARQTFEGLEELAASIKEHTQQQPIVVVQLTPYRFKLKAGARRFRAIRDILKGDTIRASIDRTNSEDDRVKFRLGQLHENIQRHDYKPFELANEFDLLLNETGWSQEQLAKEVGVTKGWVSKKLSLLKAPPEIQAAILSGEMAESDYYNNKQAKTEEVAGKREKPEGGEASPSDKPKNVSVPWDHAVGLATLIVRLAKQAGLKDVEISPEPTKKELQALLARVGEL